MIMGELRAIPPTLTRTEWNALVDHALEKSASYILRKNGSNFEAIYGSGSNQSGQIHNSNSDAEQVIQTLFNDLTEGQSVFFKNAEYPITTGLSLGTSVVQRGISLMFERGRSPYGTYGARLKTTADIDLLTLASKVSYSKIINGAFIAPYTGTKSVIKTDSHSTRMTFSGCEIYGGGNGLYLEGSDARILYCDLNSQNLIGVHANAQATRMEGTEIETTRPDAIGLKVSKDMYGVGNRIRSGVASAVEVNSPLGYSVVLQGGHLYNSLINLKVTYAQVLVMQNVVVGLKGADLYDIQILDADWASLQGLAVHMSEIDEIGIRIEGGNVLLQGCEVAQDEVKTGQHSYSKTGGTVYQRACYSWDGLLEAI